MAFNPPKAKHSPSNQKQDTLKENSILFVFWHRYILSQSESEQNIQVAIWVYRVTRFSRFWTIWKRADYIWCDQWMMK